MEVVGRLWGSNDTRKPYPEHQKKALLTAKALRIRRQKDTLDRYRQDIKDKKIARDNISFETVLADCPAYSILVDPMKLREHGCELPLYFMFLRWLLGQVFFYTVVGVAIVAVGYLPVCYKVKWREFIDFRKDALTPGPTACRDTDYTWPMVLASGVMYWFTLHGVMVHRRKQREIASKIEGDNVAPCDYSVLVRGLPLDTTETEVEVFFVKRGFEHFGSWRWPESLSITSPTVTTISEEAPTPATPATPARTGTSARSPSPATNSRAASPGQTGHRSSMGSQRSAASLSSATPGARTTVASANSCSSSDMARVARHEKIEIVKVMMCKDCTEVLKLEKDRQRLVKKLSKVDRKVDKRKEAASGSSKRHSDEDDRKYFRKCDAKRRDIKSQISTIDHRLGQRSLVSEARSTGTAIVIFRVQAVQNAILEHWNHLNEGALQLLGQIDYLLFGLLAWLRIYQSGLPRFRGKRISVKRCDHPSNLKWENIATPRYVKGCGRFVSWTVMLMVLLGCFWAAYTLTLWKRDQPEDTLLISYGTSLLLAVVLSIMNMVLSLVAYALADLEKHATRSGKDRAIMMKLVPMMVLDYCGLLYAVSWNWEKDWDGPEGLAQQVVWVCASNAVLPLMRLIDFEGLLNRLRRWQWETDEKQLLTEAEAEDYKELFMPTPVDLPIIYSGAIATFFLTLIYSPLSPVAVPALCFCGLLAQYFADKVFVCKYARKPYSSTRANNARVAVDMVSSGVLFGGVFAGFFIGFSGQKEFNSLAVGIFVSCCLLLISLLPRPLRRCLALDCGRERPAESASVAADFYEAQLGWPDQDRYHLQYPLYKYQCNPADFQAPSTVARVLWELRLWMSIRPRDEASTSIFGI